MKQLFHSIAVHKKKILWGVVGIVVALQFFRPERNLGNAASQNDITHATLVPQEIQTILTASCFDCHSDHTEYPVYTNIQPVGWWMADHIIEAKKELNFSQFNTYSIKRKIKKYREIEEQIVEGEMPLDSYLWIHGEAKLDPNQKKLMIDWAVENRMTLEKQYPDSIPKKR